MKKISNENDERLSRLAFECDVLLLADVFEKRKSNSLKNYGLYPDHYLSAPGLLWYAALTIRKIEPEIIRDPDTYIFFEKGTRGGTSYIFNRYSKFNNSFKILMTQNKNQNIK